MYAEKGEGVPA